MAYIIKPLVSEKMNALTEKENKFGFIVRPEANKYQIKKEVEDEKRVYSYKGLRLPTDETLELKFDPKFYDVNTTKISLENGLPSIEMQPRAEMRPVKKSIFGQLKLEDNSSKAIEDKSENKSE